MASIPARSRANSESGQWQRWLFKGLSLAGLAAAAMLLLLPYIWMFSTSLRLPRESFRLPPKWLPTDFAIENYATVFTKLDFPRYFGNSVFVSGLVVIGQLIFASMAAFAFARLRFPGKNFLFLLLMSALMIPIQSTIIPLFVLLSRMGLKDSLWSLILPGWSSAFGVFMLRQYFLSIPNDLEDAARVDGASIWVVYWNIMLPLVGTALAVLAVLTFNGTWNEFFRPFIFISKPDSFTLPLGLNALRGEFGTGSVSVILAGVVLALLPTLFLYIFSQRYLVEGIASTGIKG